MDIIGLGTPVMDLVVNLPYMPEKDGVVTANEMFFQGGGKVATAMAAASYLGTRCAMITRLGQDSAALFIKKDLEYYGVDVSGIVSAGTGTHSGFCFALSEEESGTRIFIGRNTENEEVTPDDIDFDLLSSGKILHLECGNPASVAAAKAAREKGMLVSMDGDHYSPEIEALLPEIDLFIGSDFYYRSRYKGKSYFEAMQHVHEAGPDVVWFTLGKKGCVGLLENQMIEIPAFSVVVKDTTGAGDVFHGAYLAALIEGRSHYDCAVFAGAAAAIKCMWVGGRTGLPSGDQVKDFLETGKLDGTIPEKRLEYYRKNFLEVNR